MKILGVDRVIHATPDPDETVEQFEELLDLSFGRKIESRTTTERGEKEFFSLISEANYEITGPRDDDNQMDNYLQKHGPGLYAVAFQVADLEDARAHLSEKGVEPVGRIDQRDFQELFYHPEHFGGVFVLLAEYPHPAETNFLVERTE